MWLWGRQFNSELLVSNFVKKFVTAEWPAEMADTFSQYFVSEGSSYDLGIRCQVV